MGKDTAIDWPELKRIDPKAREFTANGNEYRITTSLSFDRWRDYQQMEIELSFGTSMAKLTEMLIDQRSKLNKMEFAECAIINQNMLLGIATAGELKRWPTVLRMCALFINRKGEDISRVDEDVINSKIEDWKAEGYDITSFFQLAFAFIAGFASAYKNASLATSLKVMESAPSPSVMSNA